MKMQIQYIAGLVFMQTLCFSAFADQEKIFKLIIENHQFIPSELRIPPHEKVKIEIENHDPTAEEFESYDLHREKVVTGHGKIVIFIGPLAEGKYTFFGEYHKATASGTLIVSE